MSRKQACDMGFALPNEPLRSKPKKGTRTPDDDQGRDRLFDALCEAHGLEKPVREYAFAVWEGGNNSTCSHPGQQYVCEYCAATRRRWRFDYLFDGWLALEVQGGLFVKGRHARGAALLEEHEKLWNAVLLGYSVVFCVPQQVATGAICPIIHRILDAHEEQS